MANFKQADAAASSLAAMLGKPSWLLSIGVGRDDSDFWVQVSVEQSSNDPKILSIPLLVDNIPVKVISREMPKAL